MMPHIERSTFQWNWAHYPKDRNDEVSHEALLMPKNGLTKITLRFNMESVLERERL
jgi:phosphoribosylformylglycinamidine synthase